MESLPLDEVIEREARRIVAAFGMEKFDYHSESGVVADIQITWGIRDHMVSYIEVGPPGWGHQFVREPADSGGSEWWFIPAKGHVPEYNKIAARGLYCLGIEKLEPCDDLNHPLSEEDKLKLRHSMPREFWPQKWFEDEAQS